MAHSSGQHQLPQLKSKDHYPFITQLLIELFLSGSLPNVDSVQIEPVYGYVGRIVYHDGTVRFYRGSSMGLNRLGPSEVSKDKGYSKFFLEQLGYETPAGQVFLFPRFVELIDKNIGRLGFKDFTESDRILNYIDESIGYPCYLKPNEGSQGRDIEKCTTPAEVVDVLDRYVSEGALKILVEQAVPFPDYRVVILGDEVISCYLRKPLCLLGNGISTVEELLAERQRQFVSEGRDTIINLEDPRFDKGLQQNGWTRQTILPNALEWQAFQVSNLSVGGESEDFTDHIDPHWSRLCIEITAAMGLRFCGVDIACEDITRGDSKYSILEINAAPGLDNYAATGTKQAELVRDLYRRVFNESADA
jgi:D-alanine-D-alanine ligase-like ATP-grasp enzyme